MLNAIVSSPLNIGVLVALMRRGLGYLVHAIIGWGISI